MKDIKVVCGTVFSSVPFKIKGILEKVLKKIKTNTYKTMVLYSKNQKGITKLNQQIPFKRVV